MLPMLSTHDQLVQYLGYDYMANQKLMQLLLRMENIPKATQAVTSHILAAQQVWYLRLSLSEDTTEVWPDTPPEEWITQLDINYGNIRKYLTEYEQSGKSWDNKLAYQNSRGEPYETPVREILMHLAFHSAYHRGQIVRDIKPLGVEIPVSDFIAFVRKSN